MTLPPETPKTILNIDCGSITVRTLTPGDASERWGEWMAEQKNVRLLNVPAKAMTRDQVAAYIRQFDQKTHLLLGMFETHSGLHIGFYRVDIDPVLKRALMFMVIGEQRFRNWRTAAAMRVPFQDAMFDRLGLNQMLATTLTSNKAMLRYLLKSGWSLDKTAPRYVKSRTSDDMLDMSFLSMSREAWRAWKIKNQPPADRA